MMIDTSFVTHSALTFTRIIATQMLRVLSLDGATVATLEGHHGHGWCGRQVREAVQESLSHLSHLEKILESE